MNIDKLLRLPEGRKIEFKKTLPNKSDLVKTVIAFANDAGGKILIGVKDKTRQVVGVDEDKLLEMEEKISSMIYDSCFPLILPEIVFFNYNGKHIIVVSIYKGSQPPYYLREKGKLKGTYIRVGSTNRLADEDFIAELERRRLNISFDSLPVYKREVSELSFTGFRRQFEEITGEKLTDVVLEKLNLVVKDQNRVFPTNALILLSDDRLRRELFPYAKIECARFKGTEPGNFIDQKTIDVPLGFQAEDAYKFVLRHIFRGSRYEGVYRRDSWEYPVIAIREVIRNAVIHRDYSMRGKDIKVAIFDDKIEITSPGKLMPTVDFDDMNSGQSEIRNKVLAPVFKRLGIIEQWGNGLQLIANEMRDYPDIRLVWSEPGVAFRVTFQKVPVDSGEFQSQSILKEQVVSYGRKKVHEKGNLISTRSDNDRLDGMTNDLRTIYERLRKISNDYGDFANDLRTIYGRLRGVCGDCERLTNDQLMVLLFLLDFKKINRQQAKDLLSYKNTKVYEILNSLVVLGVIVRKGKGRSTYYELVSNG